MTWTFEVLASRVKTDDAALVGTDRGVSEYASLCSKEVSGAAIWSGELHVRPDWKGRESHDLRSRLGVRDRLFEPAGGERCDDRSYANTNHLDDLAAIF